MDCNSAFDKWYANQKHQLSNEELCRLIWTRGWQAATPAMPSRDEIIKLWDLAMLETTNGLDAMEYFTRAVLRPNAELCGGPSGPSERAPG